MRTILIFLAAWLMVMPGIAYDQRDGSNGVPFLPPDPSLKTTDPFYAVQHIPVVLDPNLPPIFGGPMPKPESADWMNLSEHNKKLNSTTERIIAINSYALTEYQMRRANITAGQESWL